MFHMHLKHFVKFEVWVQTLKLSKFFNTCKCVFLVIRSIAGYLYLGNAAALFFKVLFCVHSGAFLCGVDVLCAVMVSILEVIGLKQLKKVLIVTALQIS